MLSWKLVNCQLVGTHALIQAGELPAAGFSCIDEQHRFGVGQRARLQQKVNLPCADDDGNADSDASANVAWDLDEPD